MAFGFGFNKAKVLASAEKNVKAGKLHNAIQDYEKIAAEDPKDLTILNTIGDLYARVGNTDKATEHFRKVGDAYASDGFTVKAIAMYKKLTKQNPNATDVLQKLAELYTQQGLYNDARGQYLQIAEQLLKNNDLARAAKVFERALELDPDNTAMQSRLADLYVRLNKKPEARDIYFRSAQALRTKGALEACDSALEHVLSIDPKFAQAAVLRGDVKLESKDPAGAIRVLEALPDIDSRVDGLRILLRAHLALAHMAEAEPLARKILAVFNDTSGVTLVADTMAAAGSAEDALRLFRENADRLLAGNAPAILEKLNALISRVKDNPRALEILCELYRKAGDNSHLPEATELLAHAYVQTGALAQARDLYKNLAEIEPENPLHAQNYRQIVAKLGEDSAARPLSAAEGKQAFMVDELETKTIVVDQQYSEEVTAALQAALTDAELFSSYNLPVRAIPVLEAVLPRAPHDVRLNQQLASLYAKVGRTAEAAQCCTVLAEVFRESGHAQEALEYSDMARKYGEGGPVSVGAIAAPPAADGAAAPPPQGAEFGEGESAFGPDAFGDAFGFAPAPPAPAAPVMAATPVAPPVIAAPLVTAAPPVPEVSAPLPDFSVEPAAPAPAAATGALPEFELPAPAVGEFAVEGTQATDFTVEPAPSFGMEPAAGAVAEMPAAEAAAAFEVQPAEAAEPAEPPVAHEIDLSDEWNRMSAEVHAAAGAEAAAAVPAAKPRAIAELVEEITFYLSQSMWEEARAALNNAEALSPGDPALVPLHAQLQPAAAPAAVTFDVAAPPAPVPEPLVSSAADESGANIAEFVFDSSALGAPPAAPDIAVEPPAAIEPTAAPPVEPVIAPKRPAASPVTPPPVVAPPAPPAVIPPAATPARPAAAAKTATPAVALAGAPAGDVLGGFVLDLEESLGEDFNVTAPHAAAASTPAAAAAAKAPIAPPAAPPAPAAPVLSAAATPGAAAEPAPSALSDLFAEFKQDMEGATASGQDEDPETHYNLGVAFKEMGLLDEAIGELQKVCQAIDHGTPFGQVIEAYTWLADCFVQKGVPEAGVRWYEKALTTPGISDESSTAIHYELASAFEAAGDRARALQHFMEVYGTNIDYRDVAERIKALKS